VSSTPDTLTGQTTAERAQGAYKKGQADERARAASSSSSSPSSTASAPPSSSTSTRTTVPEGGRLVVGLMVTSAGFAIGTNAVRHAQGAAVPVGDARILLGGSVATVALVMLTHGGDAARSFAVGLALVTAVTSMLVFGGPVWETLGKYIGSTKPSPPTGSTSPSTPSTPTSGTSATTRSSAS
jgi:hypothetical protein